MRSDGLAVARVTPDGLMFNRFAVQVVLIDTSTVGANFFNTSTKTHETTIPNAIVVKNASTRLYQDPIDPPEMIRCWSDNSNGQSHCRFCFRWRASAADDVVPVAKGSIST